MPQPDPCPRCRAVRLSVVYFDAKGRPLGGHLHCPDCGPRHSALIAGDPAADKVRRQLLERKAS